MPSNNLVTISQSYSSTWDHFATYLLFKPSSWTTYFLSKTIQDVLVCPWMIVPSCAMIFNTFEVKIWRFSGTCYFFRDLEVFWMLYCTDKEQESDLTAYILVSATLTMDIVGIFIHFNNSLLVHCGGLSLWVTFY